MTRVRVCVMIAFYWKQVATMDSYINVTKCKIKRMHGARNYFFLLRFSSCQLFGSLDKSEDLFFTNSAEVQQRLVFFNTVKFSWKDTLCGKGQLLIPQIFLKSSNPLIILCQSQRSQNFLRCISTVVVQSHALNLTGLASTSTLNSQVWWEIKVSGTSKWWIVLGLQQRLKHWRW